MLIKEKGKIKIIEEPKVKVGLKCFICGRVASAIHHIFEGNGRRKIADREGLTIAICNTCHNKIHHYHSNEEELKALAQKIWLEQNGNDKNKWYKLFYRFWEE